MYYTHIRAKLFNYFFSFHRFKAGAQISLADVECSEEWCTKWYNLLNYMYIADMDGKHKGPEACTQPEVIYTYTYIFI